MLQNSTGQEKPNFNKETKSEKIYYLDSFGFVQIAIGKNLQEIYQHILEDQNGKETIH
jgi:hypothetical protein